MSGTASGQDGAARGGKPHEEAIRGSRTRLWRDLRGLLGELWSAQPVASLGMLALLLVGNARTGLYLLAMGGLVDALTRGLAGAGDGGVTKGHSALFWVAVYVGASAVEELYWGLEPILSAYLLDHGTHRIQRRVLERAALAPLIQFEEGEFFSHLQRATAGMGERLAGLYRQLALLFRLLVMLGATALTLLFVHPVLPLLLLVGSLPAVWLHARVATLVYEAQRAHTMPDRLRTHLQKLLTGREAAAEVRLFDVGGYLLDRWWKLRLERQRDLLEAQRRRALFTTGGDLVSGLAYAASLVLVASLTLQGQLTLGDYVAVATGALWFQEALGAFVATLRSLEEQSQFLGDLFDFWRVARVEEGPPNGEQLGGRASMGQPSVAALTVARPGVEARSESGMAVQAEGLTFAYPGSPRPVVRDVSLRIEPGERLAIVGENGAGKTTLVKLLLGLYQPDAGVVRLDGEPLTLARIRGVRRRIAAVFQDYASFQLTVREGIGFGDLGRLHDDRALASAAERAGIASLVERLPAGYDAYLGREFGETELSGGEWQRVALARAFFGEAALLVLDEPTAALDPLAELALFERFAELARGRTAIMVSHRLGAARIADRIVVLAHGRVVESGRHEALLALGGEYARLFAAQAQWYR